MISQSQAPKNEETHYIVPNSLPQDVVRSSVVQSIGFMVEGM